jgi:magnesium transporter
LIVDQALYVDGKRSEEPFVLEGARQACRDPGVFAWIGLYEPTEEEFATVAAEFNLHELAVEDGHKVSHQRPKLELYDDTMLVVLKTARYVDTEEVVDFGEIALFLSKEFVVAVRHGPATALAGVRRRIEDRPDLLSLGPGAVLYGIVDKVVDDYMPVMDGLDNDIQEVEQEVFSAVGGGDNPAERIYYLKREVLEFDRAAHPLLEPLDQLAKGRFEQLPEELHSYFRDVADHLTRVVEQINQYRDLLTSILEANLTQVGVRQNNDMRKITSWVAIAAVPTMLAGVWGMNFEFMPELTWPFGYPLALGTMAGASLFIYRKLKKSGWL